MPSIPQSLLWISLVVLWLFVLVPMLINKRDTVRRTSDVALATRVVNGGVKSRLIRRSGPAAGHRHDPDWRPVDAFVEDYPDLPDEVFAEASDQREVIREFDEAVREARVGTRSRSVMVLAAVSEQTLIEPDYLDVDVVDENSGALPVGRTGVQASLFDELREKDGDQRGSVAPAGDAPETVAPVDEPVAPVAEPVAESAAEPVAAPVAESESAPPRPDGSADEYEYIDDTSGLEVEDEPATPVAPRSPNRQRRLSTATAAAVTARKYRFRKRVLMVMSALTVLSAVLSLTVSAALWWSCAAVATVTFLYLGYLRRQTRIEAQVRRRRQQRMARSRPLVDDAIGGAPFDARFDPRIDDQPAPRSPGVDFTEFPTRLQRPGAVVLDIDDEDPVFEHLDEVPYSRRYYGRPEGQSGRRPEAPSRGITRDLPRASGQ